MIYIIKQFLNLSLIFILFSCSIITNSTNTAEYLNSFIKDDLVNEEVYQNYEYSFISVKNTSFNHAYLILKEYENDVAIWVDGDGNEITTNNYRVSSTQGLRRNMALKCLNILSKKENTPATTIFITLTLVIYFLEVLLLILTKMILIIWVRN